MAALDKFLVVGEDQDGNIRLLAQCTIAQQAISACDNVQQDPSNRGIVSAYVLKNPTYVHRRSFLVLPPEPVKEESSFGLDEESMEEVASLLSEMRQGDDIDAKTVESVLKKPQLQYGLSLLKVDDVTGDKKELAARIVAAIVAEAEKDAGEGSDTESASEED